MCYSKKHFLLFFLFGILPGSMTYTAQAESGLSRYEIQNLLRHKIAELKQLASRPDVISAVLQSNQQNTPVETILKIDREWSNYSINHPYKEKMYSTSTGKIIRQFVEHEESSFSEILLTDNQGANVAAWPITTDYWQGDEAKWHRSFNNGNGEDYIGNVEFDESSQSKAIQVSIPVVHESMTIGVLIGAIKLSDLQAKYLKTLQK